MSHTLSQNLSNFLHNLKCNYPNHPNYSSQLIFLSKVFPICQFQKIFFIFYHASPIHASYFPRWDFSPLPKFSNFPYFTNLWYFQSIYCPLIINMVFSFGSDWIRSVLNGSNLIKCGFLTYQKMSLQKVVTIIMRINVPRSICSLIYVSDDLFCCRLCNRQKTAAPNVIIINTFSQNLPDFLQNHLKLYPIFFKLHIW